MFQKLKNQSLSLQIKTFILTVAKPDSVHQLIPFKLSEDSAKSSPKHYQQQQQQPQHQKYHQTVPGPSVSVPGTTSQYYASQPPPLGGHHTFDTRRGGSPPTHSQHPNPNHHAPHGGHHHAGPPLGSTLGGSLRYTNSTLPKTAKTTVTTNYGSASGANSDDDKVIYF